MDLNRRDQKGVFPSVVAAFVGAALLLLCTPPAFAQELIPLRVNSVPAGAEVFVDGVSRGETPVSLQLPSGAHELFIYKKGYVPQRKTVTWSTGERPSIKETLRPQQGGLIVISDPPGAQVFLDRRPLGLTPLAYENIKQGPYELELSLPGFDTYKTGISVDDEDTNEVRVRLTGPPVRVFVEAEAGARVFLDGSFAGEVTAESLSFPARPGGHELRIELNGFASVEPIQLQPGQDAILAPGPFRRIPGVEEPETAKISPRWYLVGGAVVATGAGITLGTLGLVEAHQQRDEYERSWRRSDIQSARSGIESGNRQFLIGSLIAVAGGAGIYFAWPKEDVTVSAAPGSLSFAWRF